MIAYDLETTRIAVSTPRPVWITAFSEAHKFQFESSIRDMAHLADILEREFLTDEFAGCSFVAWNGNRFDAVFVAVALIGKPEFAVRPYMTRGGSVRGVRVIKAEDLHKRNPRSWEFLDGIAMTGLAGVSLSRFLKTFAPEHEKLTGVIDFEREEFDPKNPKHRDYAMRDSVGLYYGMTRAQAIMFVEFGEALGVTMGGACVKIFQANIPPGVIVHMPRDEILNATRDYTLRGGYCFCVRRYHGPVWKYDLNQAYAAAMREADLPAGVSQKHYGLPAGDCVYIARVTARNPRNRIPFYYRTEIDGRLRATFGVSEIRDTWLTSLEVRQLLAEGWHVDCTESYSFESKFSMRDYVDRLERVRMTCEGGPSGAIGTMVKATGNHSYGKLGEILEPIEFVVCAECPPDFAPYYPDGLSDPLPHVYYRYVTDQREKAYHKPHIGAVITAHVRMVVRRAALIDPDSWIYADTDCVVFTRDVTHLLDIDAKRYGAWKVEESGTVYRFIAKKVYASDDLTKRSAKGMHVRELTGEDFAAWYAGAPPVQDQVQRNAFLLVMQGAEMFRSQTRHGTAVEVLA